MKKLFKIIGISLLIVLILLIATPFLFQNKIKDVVKTYLNNNIDAKVDFNDVSLSFLSSFPDANVTVENFKVINFNPFKDETFVTAKSLSFDMSIKELFKKPSDDPIEVKSIIIDEALLTFKTDKFGKNNYDIAKKTDKRSIDNEVSSSFTFNIEDYAITNSALSYLDELSNINLSITELNHTGNGTFSSSISEFNTHSEANISLSIDSTKYLSNNSVKLDAVIDLDLNQNKYTFKENKGYINQLPLEFEGFVKMLEKGQELDIRFKNIGASFKDFLAVIPQEYSKDLENIKTSGNFKVNGLIKGLNFDKTIPTLDINIESSNASFKYPDLPKSVDDIFIKASIKNDSGNPNDTYINIGSLNFRIDQDRFKSSAKIKNLNKNMLVDATIDGTLNLANMTKAYPIELDHSLSGVLSGKLRTIFDRNAIETNAYERIKNTGNVNVTNFIFSSKDIVNPINISRATISFKPGLVTLQSFDATTGNSDLKATGTINNLLGFLISDKKLQGSFIVNSKTFAINDFMVEESLSSSEKKATESLKIPAFLDCTINANAKTVIYDNLNLKDVKGNIIIKDEKAIFNNVKSNIFGGNLTLTGNVDTKPRTPVFLMDIGVNNFDISQSFEDLELFQNLAPIAKALQGKFNSTLNVKGTLDNEFKLNYSSITGNAFAELLTTTIEPKNAVLFDKLKNALSFVDFDELELKDLKTDLTFANGSVNVKPFSLLYKDISINIDGSHGFDKTMSYKVVLDVPAKYLGNEVNDLIAKIDDNALNDISIPVTATVDGSIANPKVSTDITSGISKLSKKLIEIQKQKLINQGKKGIKDLLKDSIGGNNSDTTKAETTDPVKDVLDDIIGNKNPQTDSTSKDPIKNILGGILSGTKKQEDTIN